MGTPRISRDEWIELRNNTDRTLDLRGWTLRSSDGSPSIPLAGVLEAGRVLPPREDRRHDRERHRGRSDLHGRARGQRRDPRVAGRCGADRRHSERRRRYLARRESKASRSTMERVNPFAPDQDPNWRTNDGTTRNGKDAKGNPLNGTPRSRNSCTNPPAAGFSWSPDPATIWDAVLFLDESTDGDGTVLSWAWTLRRRRVVFRAEPHARVSLSRDLPREP